ncbi:MAG: hypothetical protein KJ718_06540 [Nanoarchaeota archaeon]|nr:hypothetical protein [Nanoarchaeota archaeon]MBU1052176.1 hypothetical protein [Nanoarchaeota archaeon]MBU1988588.1 hypothetical protein [Nanoarchaeota archaeon]
MNQTIQNLTKLGLTEGEAKVYASLLELGQSTVGPLTKRSRVAYSNIYEVLQRLMEKGIATVIIKNNVKNFQAVSPSNLSKYLEKKQEELNDQKEILKKALPQIEALEQTFPKQEAQLFIGPKGLRAAYKEFFKGEEKSDINYWTYVHDKKHAKVSDDFYLKNWEDIAKNIKTIGLANIEYRSSPFIKRFIKKKQIRFVDFPLFSHGETFRDRFLLISWEHPIIAVLVTAKHVSENFNRYFDSIWKIAKP